MKLNMDMRESAALMVRYFGNALKLRRNNPRIIPEAYALASHSLHASGLSCDTIVDDAAPYPYDDDFELDELTLDVYANLLRKCREDWKVPYVEIDVSAYSPRMQRTLLELGFIPAAYVPALTFHHVERLDILKMIRILGPLDLGPLDLLPEVEVLIGGTLLPGVQVTAYECLGERSLLAASAHSASAHAATPVEAAVLPHDDLKHLLRRRPDIGVVLYFNLAQELADKLKRSDKALLQYTS